jgi:molecular chaperone DnaK
VKDAEAHAEEDRLARELVETRNRADSMVHSVQKALKDAGDKAGDDKGKIEAALADLQTAMKGDDKADIEAKTQALGEASHKLAEHMYAQAAGSSQAPGDAAAEATTPPADDKVVDAEFEEVKDKKKD